MLLRLLPVCGHWGLWWCAVAVRRSHTLRVANRGALRFENIAGRLGLGQGRNGNLQGSERGNDVDPGTGELVHLLQEFDTLREGQARGDEPFRVEFARSDHAKEYAIAMRLNAVASVDFQFAGYHEVHGNFRMALISEHEAYLDVTPALGQTSNRIEAGLSASQSIHGNVRSSSSDVADCG